MWKKSDQPDSSLDGTTDHMESTAKGNAVVGEAILVNGDISGTQDLLVDGRVEGSIKLGQHSVIVGKKGRVKATIHARTIIVEGQVEGDLHGDEQILVRRTGDVNGNITAPRVGLEDGAKFKGSIDMEPKHAAHAHRAIQASSEKQGG